MGEEHGNEGKGAQGQNSGAQQAGAQAQGTPAFDYEKLAAIITGKQTVTEDTVLKSYFKQQGLSADEMTQAITAFKTQKAASTPDVKALQAQAEQAKTALRQAAIEKQALLMAGEIGVEVKNIGYLLKLADLTKATAEDGAVDEKALKEALEAVLTDIPGLKAEQAANGGFVQVGAAGGKDGFKQNGEDALKAAFGIR